MGFSKIYSCVTPIIESEVLLDGIHDQAKPAELQEDLITTTYKYTDSEIVDSELAGTVSLTFAY